MNELKITSKYKKDTYKLTNDLYLKLKEKEHYQPELYDSVFDLDIIEYDMVPMINKYAEMGYIKWKDAETIISLMNNLYNAIETLQREEVKILKERGII